MGSGPSSTGVSTNLEPDWILEQSSNPARWAVTGDPETLYSLMKNKHFSMLWSFLLTVAAGWKPGQKGLGSAKDHGHGTSMGVVATSNTSSEPAYC